jgi:hypothetical protein
MSIESWKAEFYPMETRDTLEVEAIQHSLTKWVGLMSQNLSKHGLIFNSFTGNINEDNETEVDPSNNFSISYSTCSLCYHYYDKEENMEQSKEPCYPCPIFQLINRPCTTRGLIGKLSPFDYWVMEGNPLPMISLLRDVLAAAQEQEEEEENNES